MDAKKGRSLGRLPRGRGGAVSLRECHLDKLEVPPYECNTRCFSFCNTARLRVKTDRNLEKETAGIISGGLPWLLKGAVTDCYVQRTLQVGTRPV